MVWIRIFRTRTEAERAQDVLAEGGFKSVISEDKIFGIPIQKLGVPARFRLMVAREDYEKIAEFLAGKIKKR
jgi:hypothetical protein